MIIYKNWANGHATTVEHNTSQLFFTEYRYSFDKILDGRKKYHQDYIKHNPESGYVQKVSIPEIKHFQRQYLQLINPRAANF